MLGCTTIINVTINELDAFVKTIMEQLGIDNPIEVLRMVKAGELRISVTKPRWIEKEGIVYFQVTSDGTSGRDWISRLKRNLYEVDDYVECVLRSKYFKPTSGVTYEIAVLKGGLFIDKSISVQNIRKSGKAYKFTTPSAEVACLIREKFSDRELKAMRLNNIATMHRPIKDSYGNPLLLVTCGSIGGPGLCCNYEYSDSKMNRSNGFAFVSSIVSESETPAADAVG